MLERLPKTRLALADAKPANREVIVRAIAVQSPMVEKIKARMPIEEDHRSTENGFWPLFREMTPFLDLPVKPNRDFLFFAKDVAHAWDATSFPERREAGLHRYFFTCGMVESVYFGGLDKGGSNARMGVLIFQAERSITQIDTARLMQGFKNGQITLEELRAAFDKIQGLELGNARIDGDSVAYTTVKDGSTCSSRVNVGQLPNLIASMERKLFDALVGMARRLAVGYNPIL